MKTVALYGGSFDPPHVGHRAVIDSVLASGSVDRLYVIPCRTVNGKDDEHLTSNAEIRMNLCRAAFGSLPSVTVSPAEINREGPSYTAETVRLFRDENPDTILQLVIGEDKLPGFLGWVDAEYILSECEILVASRKTGIPDSQDFPTYRRLSNRNVEISSAELRELLKQGEGNQFLDDAVYSQIIRDRLYEARPNFDWLRKKSYAFLKKKRIPHVAGCEQTAVELAKRFGCDVYKAAEAAILHDITKKIDYDGQLLLCSKYGIICDDGELSNGKLLHSKTGAYFARDLFGIEEDVFNAILWHTTGKPEMSLLEKIIYLADYVEPTRDFPGVDELRKTVYSNLDAGMALGLKMSLAELQSIGIIPHRNSLEAYAYYKEEC